MENEKPSPADEECKSFVLTGDAKDWTAQKDGAPGIFDASAYKGSDGAVLNLNAGPGHPSIVGNEHVFIADGTTIRHAIGTVHADALIGNLKGGSILEGGAGNDYYELSGMGNLVILGPGNNSCFLHMGCETVIRGFKPEKDYITLDIPEDMLVAHAKRMAQGLSLHIPSAGGQDIRILLEGFDGTLSSIRLENHRPKNPMLIRIEGE